MNRAVEDCILLLRGERVLLDFDLARLYGVETKALNQAVRRNLERFPMRTSERNFDPFAPEAWPTTGMTTAFWVGEVFGFGATGVTRLIEIGAEAMVELPFTPHESSLASERKTG